MTEEKFWLMKSEPDAYSIDTLKNDGVTLWDGIRNYQFFKTVAIIKGSLFISQNFSSVISRDLGDFLGFHEALPKLF